MDGRPMPPGEIEFSLEATSREIVAVVRAGQGDSRDISAILREVTGKTGAERAKDARLNRQIMTVLRDSAVRMLHTKRGMSVRDIAEYLYISHGVTQRALAPGAAAKTNEIRRKILAATGKMPSAPISKIRELLRDAAT